MILSFNDFKGYYRNNSTRAHINFCRPVWDSNGIGDSDFAIIDRSIVGAIGFSHKIDNLATIDTGVTDGLMDALDDLIPLEDVSSYSDEEIYEFDNGQKHKGVAAIRHTLNRYTGNQYKTIAFGVILGQNLIPGRPAIYLQLTFSLWSLITRVAMQLVSDSTKVLVSYHPDSFSNSYYQIDFGDVTMICLMKSDDMPFEVYFIPSYNKGTIPSKNVVIESNEKQDRDLRTEQENQFSFIDPSFSSKPFKTDDFVSLPESLIDEMQNVCQSYDQELLHSIFTKLGEGWRKAVIKQEINNAFWDYGNAIIRMYKAFQYAPFDKMDIIVPSYSKAGGIEKVSVKNLINDVSLVYSDLKG
ncbi:hypothetical protein IMPR6_160148 [Imperialibacter sp. EC-SDR9]|nr:hypothetical protein IMPERIA89_10295 [Imperialibacter sp. 89]CAD5263581.1 hypothetical protein IMPERIA75_30002 [Imperialibacter sp. 75]VVT07667.1 hypothetical protein IMPR6_160148 [Imperialibacter sp. EC-SDR9]